MSSPNKRGPSTTSVHGGRPEASSTRAEPVSPPITPAAVYTFPTLDAVSDSLEKMGSEYVYSRYDHPIGNYVEKRIGALERTEDAVLFSSGMAALAACVTSFCRPGDNVVASTDLYGGTSHMIKSLAHSQGIAVTFATPEDLCWRDTFPPETKLVLVESPANPLTTLVDFEGLMQALPSPRPLMVLDSTFATPLSQRGVEAGFDLVVHSATKFLGGHDDLLAGVVCGSHRHTDSVRDCARSLGAVCDPNTAWLLDRGLKTLALRWERQCRNAMEIALHLEQHSKVERVLYPGLESHPQHAVAKKQMNTFGAMLAFTVQGGIDGARAFFNHADLILRAPSLGGVESTMLHCATASHRQLTRKEREAMGIHDGTLRLSTGIEDPQDLIGDIDQALDRIR